MAVNMFLKLDGVAGEATQKGHKDELEVLSFSWGLAHPAQIAHTDRRRAGRVQVSDINFMMRSGKASPTLMLACATGRHLKEGLFVIEKAGEVPFAFYKVTITDVLVSSFQASGSSETPMESFSLNFRTLKFEETAQDAKGGAGATVEAAFDFARNRAL
jgi:type VI secretion system secreted protein Hcp